VEEPGQRYEAHGRVQRSGEPRAGLVAVVAKFERTLERTAAVAVGLEVEQVDLPRAFAAETGAEHPERRAQARAEAEVVLEVEGRPDPAGARVPAAGQLMVGREDAGRQAETVEDRELCVFRSLPDAWNGQRQHGDERQGCGRRGER